MVTLNIDRKIQYVKVTNLKNLEFEELKTNEI